MEHVIYILKGLGYMLLILPFAIHIMSGLGQQDPYYPKNILLRIYVVYYPIAVLAALVVGLLLTVLHLIGKEGLF